MPKLGTLEKSGVRRLVTRLPSYRKEPVRNEPDVVHFVVNLPLEQTAIAADRHAPCTDASQGHRHASKLFALELSHPPIVRRVTLYNDDMKVYISVDIEGATGIVSFSQCGRPSNEHYDFGFARRMLTHDVNAAVRGLREAGATEIVVKDAHATCKNLLVDELEPGTQLISGFGSGKDGMMDGIDESFDAALLVGYHGMAGALHAFMEHALIGGLHRFWLNGKLAGEIAMSAAVAGAYGVPLVLVTSDLAACKEAEEDIDGVRTYSTKEGYGRFMGRLKHPSETGPGIQGAARAALEAASAIPPCVIKGPTTMRAEFRNVEEADLPAQLEGVGRIDAYTLEWTRDNLMAAHRTALNVFNLPMRGRQSGT